MISVVIPTYNEAENLNDCIMALMHNSVVPGEIIVVDGGSQDGTVEIAKQLGVTVLHNAKRTAAAGRNLGIQHAYGDIIAFVDGDCIADTLWVACIEAAFTARDIDGIGGFIEPAPPRNDIERFWGDLSLKIVMNFGETAYQVQNRTLNDGFITANCAYRKTLLERLGGFDEWFANNAEDIDLSWRALQEGAVLWYQPSVKIQARSVTTLRDMKRKSFRDGISSSKLQKRFGKFINYDWRIYQLLLKNLKGWRQGETDAKLFVIELFYHLLGKYYGSMIAHVINV